MYHEVVADKYAHVGHAFFVFACGEEYKVAGCEASLRDGCAVVVLFTRVAG